MYNILTGNSMEVLTDKVNTAMNNGWVPQGGINSYHRDNQVNASTHSGALWQLKPIGRMFTQAMVKIPVKTNNNQTILKD